jgi:hypothetical protein
MKNLFSRSSIRTIGRRAVARKHWNENCEYCGLNAPAEFRRRVVRMDRRKFKHELANATAQGTLSEYEPVHIAKRNVKHLYF